MTGLSAAGTHPTRPAEHVAGHHPGTTGRIVTAAGGAARPLAAESVVRLLDCHEFGYSVKDPPIQCLAFDNRAGPRQCNLFPYPIPDTRYSQIAAPNPHAPLTNAGVAQSCLPQMPNDSPDDTDDEKTTVLTESIQLDEQTGRSIVRITGLTLLSATFVLWVSKVIFGIPIDFQFLQWWTYVALALVAGKEALQSAVEVFLN